MHAFVFDEALAMQQEVSAFNCIHLVGHALLLKHGGCSSDLTARVRAFLDCCLIHEHEPMQAPVVQQLLSFPAELHP